MRRFETEILAARREASQTCSVYATLDVMPVDVDTLRLFSEWDDALDPAAELDRTQPCSWTRASSAGRALMARSVSLGLGVLLTATACGGKSSSSGSVAGRYEPDYSASEGEVFAGNYFPLEAGSVTRLDGREVGRVNVSSDGSNENLDYDEILTLELTVLPAQSLSLPSGTYDVIPLQQAITAVSGASSNYVTQYYERAEDGTVYLRGTLTDGGLTETENPVFLKPQMVVGDSWSATPTISRTDAAGVSTNEASGELTVHVIGPETLTVQGQTMDTLRLDQVGQLSGTVVDGTTRANYELALVSTINLVVDVGLVAQRTEFELDMDLIVEGQSGRVQLDAETTYELQSLPGSNARRRLKARVLQVVRDLTF